MEFLKKCDYKGREVCGTHTSYSGRKKLPDVKSTEDFVAVLSQNRSRLARYHPHTRCCDVNGPRGCIHTSLGLHLTERRIDIHGQCPSISTSTTSYLLPTIPCNTLPSSSIPFFHTSGTNQSLNSIFFVASPLHQNQLSRSTSSPIFD